MLKTLGVESSGRSSGNVKKSGFYPKWKARETLLPAWSPSDIDTRKKDLCKTHPSLNTPEVSGEVGRRCCLPFTGRWVSVGQADRDAAPAMQAACREASSGVCCQSSTRAPSQAQPGAPQINTVSLSPPQGCTDRPADIEKSSRGAQKGIIYD